MKTKKVIIGAILAMSGATLLASCGTKKSKKITTNSSVVESSTKSETTTETSTGTVLEHDHTIGQFGACTADGCSYSVVAEKNGDYDDSECKVVNGKIYYQFKTACDDDCIFIRFTQPNKDNELSNIKLYDMSTKQEIATTWKAPYIYTGIDQIDYGTTTGVPKNTTILMVADLTGTESNVVLLNIDYDYLYHTPDSEGIGEKTCIICGTTYTETHDLEKVITNEGNCKTDVIYSYKDKNSDFVISGIHGEKNMDIHVGLGSCFAPGWDKFDETGHWLKCHSCDNDALSTKEEHDFEYSSYSISDDDKVIITNACTVCGYEESKDYTGLFVADKKATCETDALGHYVVTLEDGSLFSTEPYKVEMGGTALGHNYKQKSATSTEQTLKCSNCNKETTINLPLEHEHYYDSFGMCQRSNCYNSVCNDMGTNAKLETSSATVYKRTKDSVIYVSFEITCETAPLTFYLTNPTSDTTLGTAGIFDTDINSVADVNPGSDVRLTLGTEKIGNKLCLKVTADKTLKAGKYCLAVYLKDYTDATASILVETNNALNHTLESIHEGIYTCTKCGEKVYQDSTFVPGMLYKDLMRKIDTESYQLVYSLEDGTTVQLMPNYDLVYEVREKKLSSTVTLQDVLLIYPRNGYIYTMNFTNHNGNDLLSTGLTLVSGTKKEGTSIADIRNSLLPSEVKESLFTENENGEFIINNNYIEENELGYIKREINVTEFSTTGLIFTYYMVQYDKNDVELSRSDELSYALANFNFPTGIIDPSAFASYESECTEVTE